MRATSLLLCLALSTRAFADDADAQARALYQAGEQRYAQRDFAAAEAAFQHAYELSHRAELLFNIGLCRRELGQLEPALEAFRSYIAFAGPMAESRPAVEKQIADLERILPAHLEVHSRGKRAHITIDGEVRGDTTLATTLPAGSHALVATGAGPEERLQLMLKSGEHRIVEVGKKSRTGLWVGLGVGAAVVVAGVVTAAVLVTRPAHLHDGSLDPSTTTIP